MRCLALACCLLLLAACSRHGASELPVTLVSQTPLQLDIEAEGRLRAVRATPLQVPGRSWAQQQLIWMVPDGSSVKSGEVIARFSAAQGELRLTEAMLELERAALTRATKEDALDAAVGRVEVDLVQVGSELAIASRYADADLSMFARNEILDAIEDRRYLHAKDDTLRWRRGQASDRGAAELAVIDSQRATHQRNADLRREDLDSLELIAPHDGVLMLEANWSGEKPTLGSTLWAQNEFGSLPDTTQLEVEISVPHLDAHDLSNGVKVSLHPMGQPQQPTHSELTFVATAAQVQSRQNPVRYLKMKAPIDPEAAQRYGWVPGMAFRAVLHLSDGESALSVPNVALKSAGAGRYHVYVMEDGQPQQREVTIGARGLARTHIVSGLAAGEKVVLLPDALERDDATSSSEEPEA